MQAPALDASSWDGCLFSVPIFAGTSQVSRSLTCSSYGISVAHAETPARLRNAGRKASIGLLEKPASVLW